MNPHYPLVAARAVHRCEYCRAPESVFNFPFEVEHIIPIVLDGADQEDNWALACRSCNLRKWTHITFVDPLSKQQVRLFNPRIDQWTEHFSVDKELGSLTGISAIGRATIACLELNSTMQIHARLQWIKLGLFP